MRWAFSFAVVAVLASFASPQANLRLGTSERTTRASESRQVIGNYCRLDYDGARLIPENWNRIQPFTGWRDNPDFRRIAVVVRYQISSEPRFEHGRFIYDVTYDLSGEYDLTGVYFAEPSRITTQIEVGDTNGDLRVLETSSPRPFVGRPRFQQWLQTKLNSETDPGAKVSLTNALQRLQAQDKKPAQGQ